MYDQVNATVKRGDVKIRHVTEAIRYSPSSNEVRARALTLALAKGKEAIDDYTTGLIGSRLQYFEKVYTTP